ncbi:hypothetical protein REPUB_Repub15cG0091900 [Reevesia pubescens]
MDSTSLETLQLSFRNLRLKNGKFEINNSATTPQDNWVSSSLPLNGSLTSVLPGPGLSNRERFLDSSFDPMNLNGVGYQPYGFAENLSGKTLNAGYGFEEPNLYNLASQGPKDSMFNNVNLFSGFSNGNPGLPSHPEAIPSGGNLWGNGFNIGTENPSGFWNQQKINGIVSPQGNEIITLAMHEDGSKYLQDMLFLNDSRSGIKELIFEGVIEYIFQLMTNQYGRYLFQKLIEFGSHSIKKLIKVLEKSPLVTEIVKALSNNFRELMINPTGQYVIMECLDVVDSQKNDLLYKEAIKNCLKLAAHERGCISLNNFIVRIKGPRRDELLNYICENVEFLAQDPAGNFVVQCVLGLQNPAMIEKICSKLKEQSTLSSCKG